MPSAGPPYDEPSIVAVIDPFFDAWASHDRAGLAQCLTDEVELRTPWGSAPFVRGRDAAADEILGRRDTFRQVFIEDMFVGESCVSVLSHVDDIRVIATYKIAAGKISEILICAEADLNYQRKIIGP